MPYGRQDAPTPPTLAYLARDVEAITARCLRCGWRRGMALASARNLGVWTIRNFEGGGRV